LLQQRTACRLRIPIPLVSTCCSVLQCVAESCSVLQCVAVCCSALQCVAVRCSVLLSVLQHEKKGANEWKRGGQEPKIKGWDLFTRVDLPALV